MKFVNFLFKFIPTIVFAIIAFNLIQDYNLTNHNLHAIGMLGLLIFLLDLFYSKKEIKIAVPSLISSFVTIFVLSGNQWSLKNLTGSVLLGSASLVIIQLTVLSLTMIGERFWKMFLNRGNNSIFIVIMAAFVIAPYGMIPFLNNIDWWFYFI